MARPLRIEYPGTMRQVGETSERRFLQLNRITADSKGTSRRPRRNTVTSFTATF
jgi:hypothetical protein